MALPLPVSPAALQALVCLRLYEITGFCALCNDVMMASGTDTTSGARAGQANGNCTLQDVSAVPNLASTPGLTSPLKNSSCLFIRLRGQHGFGSAAVHLRAEPMVPIHITFAVMPALHCAHERCVTSARPAVNAVPIRATLLLCASKAYATLIKYITYHSSGHVRLAISLSYASACEAFIIHFCWHRGTSSLAPISTQSRPTRNLFGLTMLNSRCMSAHSPLTHSVFVMAAP